MATKDLIKKLRKTQSVKPAQLIQPEKVTVKIVSAKDNESVDDIVKKDIESLMCTQSKFTMLKKQFTALSNRFNAMQDGMVDLFEKYQELERYCNELEDHMIRTKKPWYKRLFKCR